MNRRSKNRIQKLQEIANQQVLASLPETPVKNEVLQNDFASAIGFGGVGPNMFPGGNAFQQVEDATTIFENLRWYMVSNMRQVLSQAYVEIGLIQTIVNVPVDDALRGGVLLKSKQLDENQIKQLQISLDRDGDLETAGWAAKWDRLFGGAGLLILVGDQDPEAPLNLKAIGKDTDLEFRDVDMWELFWDKQNTEGYDPEIQREDFEWYNYYSENLHKTRVMRLVGMKAPSFVRPRLRGWGMTVVEALVRSLNQYLKATDLGFEVLDEFKLDVYKIKNLVNTLLGPNGTTKVKQTVQMMNWQKNYQNAIVMDSEDDFDHKQLSFAGLAEAMEGIRMQVASDMRMPIIKLFGQSVSTGGLGTSSTEEMENYNSMVESEVRGKIKYHILRMCELKCQKMFGMIPDDLELEFKPLRELSPVDQETVKTQKWNRVKEARAMGDMSTLEFRDACNKGNLFDVQLDTTEDGLNPNDPEIKDIASEEDDRDPTDSKDVDDPGTDRADTRKVHLNNEIIPYGGFDKALRVFNSSEFDKASYEADGGDKWIEAHRGAIYDDPQNVDRGLWEKANDASMKAYGIKKWQFVTWWYKKQGGKFS